MKSKILVGVLLLLMLWVPGLGCTSSEPTDATRVDIRGKITIIHGADEAREGRGTVGVVLVDGAIERDTEYDKATVTIKDSTRIFDRRGGGRRRVSFDFIKIGQRVEVRFTGPVLESYPVQATAAEVVILEND